ncbi:MAG: tetratricopeptide repeat protein [Verrucomicrobia bacterium]|nr:tetratricopeptide repeat protein [Verrucomicrobiota bacterium]
MKCFLLFAFVLLTGCATTPTHTVPLTGDILVDGPNMIANGPPRDKVLWQYRTAAAAMRQGKFDVAKPLLDDALLTLGGIYGKDADARKSRSYFHAEAKKTFIGEPYERAMAYFYRGIIYWMDGEPDNARACFRSAEFEDSDAEDKKYAGDWVLPDYLDGLATTKLAGDGSDALKRARANSKNINLPDYNPKANVLVFLEFGPGPLKYGGGQYGEQLRIRTRSSSIVAARIKTGAANFPIAPTDDVNFQATTRGGRVMDHVLGNKAVFKSATDTIGDAAIISGAILASGPRRGRHDATDEVGAGLMLAGIVSKIFSAATTPESDTRTWDNLPQFVSFATMSLPPGQHAVTVEFLEPGDKVVAKLTKQITVNIPNTDRDKVVFVSDSSITPQTQ